MCWGQGVVSGGHSVGRAQRRQLEGSRNPLGRELPEPSLKERVESTSGGGELWAEAAPTT